MSANWRACRSCALRGLDEADARALLETVIPGPIDERVRDRIVAETRGNPLALLELPRGMSAAELAGGFAVPAPLGLSGSIEDGFRRRLDALPADTRRLLQLAAADPVGEPLLCGERPSGSGSIRRPRRRRSRRTCSRSARRSGSVIRWCARRRTARRPRPSAPRCTRRSPRPPMPSSIPTGAHGTAPRPHPDPTRRSPRNWNARPPARRHAEASPRPPRFSRARRRSRPTPPSACAA